MIRDFIRDNGPGIVFVTLLAACIVGIPLSVLTPRKGENRTESGRLYREEKVEGCTVLFFRLEGGMFHSPNCTSKVHLTTVTP